MKLKGPMRFIRICLAEKYYLESLLKLSRQLKNEGMTVDKTCMICQYGKDGDWMQQRKSYPYAIGPVGFTDGLVTAALRNKST